MNLFKMLSKNREFIINLSIMVSIFIFLLRFFKPELLLEKTVISGGDTASQYYPAKYLTDYLLPHGKIIGWSPGWYAGIPIFQFYFPLPFILIALIAYVIPLQIAVKLVTVSGVFLLPVMVFLSLKIMKFKFPVPIIGSLFTLPFLFMEANSMWGGNIPSTLAGEFSYSISLSFSILFFGTFYRGLKENKYWALNGILYALILNSHIITAMWVGLTSLFFLIIRLKQKQQTIKQTIIYFFKTYGLSLLLVSFWFLPLLANLKYTTSYADTWSVTIDQVLPKTILGPSLYKDLKNPPLNLPVTEKLPFWRFISVLTVLNTITILYLIKNRDIRTAFWFFSIMIAVLLFLFGEHVGVINIRFVPFFQLSLLITACIGLNFLDKIKFNWVIALLILIGVIFWVNSSTSFIDFWIKWNYEGFENKTLWPAYREVSDFIKGDYSQPRVVYEHSSEHDKAGTTRAFESIPLFSGRATLEGLYMQSTVSSPFVFYMQSEISKEQSCPFFNQYPCTSFNLERGIEHMKMFNVNEYIAVSEQAKNAANQSKQMRLEKSIGPYSVYEITTNKNSYVTVPDYWPVQMKTENWREVSYDWFKNGDMGVPIIFTDKTLQNLVKVNDWRQSLKIPVKEKCIVKEQVMNEEIRFTTDCVGKPHIIKVSYYPNWKVDGAKKIYLISPSFMLVFPEKNQVRVWYGSTAINYLSNVLTIIGICIVIYFIFLNNNKVTKFLKR